MNQNIKAMIRNLAAAVAAMVVAGTVLSAQRGADAGWASDLKGPG